VPKEKVIDNACRYFIIEKIERKGHGSERKEV